MAQIDKEPWNFQKFVASYNAQADKYGSWNFILSSEEELKSLQHRYQHNPYVNTISEYGVTVFVSEQQVDDIAPKYKDSNAKRVTSASSRHKLDPSE